MDDLKQPRETPSALPPGCRFYPSDEHVFSYYLTIKNTPKTILSSDDVDDDRFGFNVIKEIDLYGCDPCDLPEIASFSYGYRARKRHWYCFTAAVDKEDGRRRRRKAGGGYWKRNGRVRNVLGSGKGHVVLGTRTSFDFYLGKSQKKAVRTDWVMYEYALANHLKDFVLCRVFMKYRCSHSLSDHVSSTCADESSSAADHIGVPQDNTVASNDIAQSKTGDVKSPVEKDDDISALRVAQEIDEMLTKGAVSRFEIPPDTHPTDLVSSPMHNFDHTVFIDDETELLASILEGDYLEWDDLLIPLLNTDNIG